MPADRKPASRRQRSTTRDVGLIEGGAFLAAPPPPAGLTKTTRDRWARFWSTPMAGLVKPSDMPALERLFQLYADEAKARRAVRGKWMVAGSMGQLVAHPLLGESSRWRKEILDLERQFGIAGPLSRLKLGVEFGAAARSLADLNAEIEADDDRDEDATAEEDPRLVVVRSRPA